MVAPVRAEEQRGNSFGQPGRNAGAHRPVTMTVARGVLKMESPNVQDSTDVASGARRGHSTITQASNRS